MTVPTVPMLANLKKLHVAVAGLLLTLGLTLGPAIQASAYTDGLSFVNCNGRYSMGTVNLDAGFGVTGTVTAYGCSNGYFYVVTKSNSSVSMAATLTRSNPSGQQVASSGGSYQVITNMLARINGACYNVYGSIKTTGNGWRFCW